MRAVTGTIAAVEGAAVDTGDAAVRMLSAAEQLTERTDESRRMVTDFLARVKAA